MQFGEKIKLLRKEKGYSQAELGKLISGDARQISLYETNKISPSSEAIKNLAKVFSISIDFLLFDEAVRRPLILEKDEALEEAEKLKILENDDRISIIQIINSLVKKAKLKDLANA